MNNTPESDPVKLAAAVELALEEGGAFTVKNNCMAPALPQGTRMIIEKSDPAQLKAGDIILHERSGQFFLHRFVGIHRGNIISKSDARLRPDLFWPTASLRGKAVQTIDSNGTPSQLIIPRTTRLKSFLYLLVCKVGMATGFIRNNDTPPFPVTIMGKTWKVIPEDCAPEQYSKLASYFIPECVHGIAPSCSLSVMIKKNAGSENGEESETNETTTISGRGFEVTCFPDLSGSVVAENDSIMNAALDIFFRTVTLRLAGEKGLCLHASSAINKNTDRLYIFAGPSGTGKTTSASTFGHDNILDDDFVALFSDNCAYSRRDHSPLKSIGHKLHQNHLPRAIFLPEKGERFSLVRLNGAQALAKCLHLPPTGNTPESVEKRLTTAAEIVSRIPVYRLVWKKGEALPALIENALMNGKQMRGES
ncbi:MAG: hypothetical protein JXR97_00805 [Planctomycetes bacterium]|nr:hypothetical protein [Planctomycetota bacterium]